MKTDKIFEGDSIDENLSKLSTIVEQLDEDSLFAMDIKQLVKSVQDAAVSVERFVNELDVTFFGENEVESKKGNLPELLQDVRETQEVAKKALKTMQEIEIKGDVSLRGKTFGSGDDAYMDVNVVVGMKDRPNFLLFGVDDIGVAVIFPSYGYRWRWISLWEDGQG